jgi:hypothetical protein
MWSIYDAKGNKKNIPPDSFVFWSTLYETYLLSEQEQTSVLWCANSMTCFGATMMDTDTWKDLYGQTISGQWRVQPQTSGCSTSLRLQLIKPYSIDLFPDLKGPAWLTKIT